MNSLKNSLPPQVYQQLLLERLRRKAQQKSERRGPIRYIPDEALIEFTERTFPGYIAEPAHRLIAQTLVRVVRSEIKKCMIFAPPQVGKSELTSVRLPAFWLGERPNDPVILAAYGAALAEDKGRQARDLVESDEYQDLYPAIRTDDGSRAVQKWNLVRPFRGSMLSVGVGGPITGRGALLGIIDDPFANWEQAQSPTYREKVWNWYRTTFRTRIWKGGSIVLIMTRWHEDDLAGRLLAEQGDEWFILRLPAEAETQDERDENNRLMGLPEGQPDPLGREPREPLTPIRFDRETLDELKRDVGTMAWYAEYQGAPRAPEGNTFKRSWFEIVEVAPYQARRVRAWDKAATPEGGAYTTGTLMAFDPATRLIFIEDVVRGQWSTHEREKIMRQTAEVDAAKYGSRSAVTIWLEQEPGSGGKDSAIWTIGQLAGFVVRKEPASKSGDKLTRARPFASYSEAGMVRLVRGRWNQAWLDEITAVPNNAFWDQLDSAALAFNKLVIRDGKARKGSVARKRAGT